MSLKLSEQARKVRNEYARQYRQKNPDKIKGYNVQYWERKASELENIDVTAISVTPVTDDKISVTTCLNCGNPFKSKRSDAKFCSSKCRVSFNRKNHEN